MTDGASSSTFMDGIRARAREERKGKRDQKRSNALNAKRLHLSEVQNESQDISDDKVKELALKLKKCPKDRVILLALKRAFMHGNEEKEAFLRVSGALHVLIGLLTGHDASLQLEALGCLINLLTADHKVIKAVVREASPYLITYLHSGGAAVQELAVWALGNIAADCQECCAVLKVQNFLQAVVALLKISTGNVLHSALFALKCYMLQSQEDWRKIFQLGLDQCLPHFLQSPANENVLLEAANILFFLSTCADYDQYLHQSGCLEVAVHQLCCLVSASTENDEVYLAPSACQLATFLVRSLAGMCASSATAAQATVSAANIRPALRALLFCNYLHLQKEALWLLCNITGHANTAVATSLSRDQALLKAIAAKLFGPTEIVEQGIICLCNLLAQKSEAVSLLVPDDVLCRLLGSGDPAVTSRALLLASLLPRTGNCKRLLEVISDLARSEDQDLRQPALALLEAATL